MDISNDRENVFLLTDAEGHVVSMYDYAVERLLDDIYLDKQRTARAEQLRYDRERQHCQLVGQLDRTRSALVGARGDQYDRYATLVQVGARAQIL